jgi:hypothetical protein
VFAGAHGERICADRRGLTIAAGTVGSPVDGGIDAPTSPLVVRSGATVLVAGDRRRCDRRDGRLRTISSTRRTNANDPAGGSLKDAACHQQAFARLRRAAQGAP